MKKVIVFVILVLAVFIFPCINVSAQNDYSSLVNELEINTDISSGLTPEVQEFINNNNLSVDNTDVMTKITPTEVLSYIWKQFKNQLSKPLKILASLLAIILIAAVIESMEDSLSNKPISKIFGIICVLISVGLISDSVSDSIQTAADTLNSGGTFMIGYVPVFAGITASSGNITSAVAYNMLVLLVAQTAVKLSGEIIIPSLSVCMAMGIIEAINPDFKLSGITAAVKKTVTFVMGFIMTIFIGLLTLQSIVGASADTLGVKAAKYMVSNFIPVVGGAIADTYTTVKHSLGLLRGGTGFLGIIILFITILPPLLEITAIRFAFTICDFAADLFGVSQIRVLIQNTNWILSTIFSILVCFSVMLIISTAILMLVGLNIS